MKCNIIQMLITILHQHLVHINLILTRDSNCAVYNLQIFMYNAHSILIAVIISSPSFSAESLILFKNGVLVA